MVKRLNTGSGPTGLARNGIHYFQLAQWCGTWYPYWDRPWQNRCRRICLLRRYSKLFTARLDSHTKGSAGKAITCAMNTHFAA